MRDQANDLRQLVKACAVEEPLRDGTQPTLVMLTGAKGGVGTTTIAVNLAIAAERKGLRTVLVDADEDGGDVALLCGLEERYTIADVLSGRRTVREVLQPGPGGIRVLSGIWGLERLSDFTPAAGKRLLDQLQGAGQETDLAVLDVGDNPSRVVQPFWRAARLILVVTLPDVPAVIDAYATVKKLVVNEKAEPIRSLINRCPDEGIAENAHGRLAQACRRFLALDLPMAEYISDASRAVAVDHLFAMTAPKCRAARHIDRLITMIAASRPKAGSQSTSAGRVPPRQMRMTA
ncbi:MAG: P-loop NTPase [Pirellulales bacterium]|nr:P-loop NTPase [Pirellulales bacterium]